MRLNWLVNKINGFFESQQLGPMERVTLPLKFLVIATLVLIALFTLGTYISNGLTAVYIWLFLLSMWAMLHIKKSGGTWGRFDEIDQRDSDFAEEVDRRFALVNKELKELKTKQKKAPKKAEVKKAKAVDDKGKKGKEEETEED